MIDHPVQRYFFALWPDKKLQAQFSAIAHQGLSNNKGRFIAAQDLHITLAFLGELSDEQLQLAIAAADKVCGEPFTVTIDRFGYWKRPKVIWLAPTSTPDPLMQLATDLQVQLTTSQIIVDQRSFKPHMTVMRKAYAKPKVTAVKPIEWRIDNFCLVRSTLNKASASYEILKQWQLT